MATLMPRLWGDITDLFETDYPMQPAHMIRVEDEVSEAEYTVRAELPGVDPTKDIQVSVDDGVMTISAERRHEERQGSRSEFRYGMLHRAVRLPTNADREHISAEYDNGVLAVHVPLSSPKAGARQIPVSGKPAS